MNLYQWLEERKKKKGRSEGRWGIMWKSSKVDTKGNSERERATIKQREKHRSEKKKKALILSRSPRHHVGSVSCLPFNDMATRLCRLSNYKATIRDEMKTVLSLSFLYYYYYNCYYLTDFIIINWLRDTHTHTSAKSKHERKDTRSIEEQAMSWNVYINKQVRIYTSCKHLLSFSIIIIFFFWWLYARLYARHVNAGFCG